MRDRYDTSWNWFPYLLIGFLLLGLGVLVGYSFTGKQVEQIAQPPQVIAPAPAPTPTAPPAKPPTKNPPVRVPRSEVQDP